MHTIFSHKQKLKNHEKTFVLLTTILLISCNQNEKEKSEKNKEVAKLTQINNLILPIKLSFGEKKIKCVLQFLEAK